MSAELDLLAYKDQLIEAYKQKVENLEKIVKAHEEKDKIQDDIIKEQKEMLEHYSNLIGTLGKVMGK